MRNKNGDNKFLGIWCLFVVCFLFVILVPFVSKSTMGHFGGVTGSLSAFDVYYFSNYPNGFENVDPVADNQKSNYYKILDNTMFEVPDGYEFVCWNTMVDGSGTSYVLDDVEKLTEKLNLYAQWKIIEVIVPDDKKIAYGDVNLNGEIDTDDYLIIEKHVNGVNLLTGDAVINADVNVDGKIDLVDVDIVKQVCLGNNRYVGFLPNNPIKIYDIYEGNIEVSNGGGNSNNGSNDEDSSGSGIGTSGGGTGSSGSGNGSSGSGTGGSSSGTSSNGNSGGSSNNKENGSSNNVEKEDNKDDVETEVIPVIYNFKYINDDKEYANTKCEVVNGESCELVLPISPSRNGYKFNGWNVDNNCLNNTMIKAPIMVSSSNTYYACFTILEVNTSKRKSYVLFIVIGICLITGRLIWYLIDNFRKNNGFSNGD